MGSACHDAAAAATVRTRKEDMNSPTKTFKRLGIVGAAAVVGLVPIGVLSTSAYAVATNPTPTLALSSTALGAANVTATNTFVTSTALPAGGTIAIQSLASSGAAETFQNVTNAGDFTVSFTPSGGTATADVVTGTPTSTSATLTVATAIPSGATVTVTVSGTGGPGHGVDNSATAASVYFSDDTSSDTTPAVNTNFVSIGNPSSATPTVTSVNPQAFSTTAGEQFTIFGSGFTAPATTGANASPVVCFVLAGTAAPTPGTSAATTCPGATNLSGVVTSAPAPAASVFSTGSEIQATSPTLTGGQGMQYNVVVYNYNAAGATFTAGSATSATTDVAVSSNTGVLNFVPESGVRTVDSRIGLGLPTGTLPVGTPVAIPLSAFEPAAGSPASFATPTNVPSATATALSLNVTAVGPASAGNLQVWAATSTACGGIPATSTVNFQAPQDTGNATIIAVTPGTTNDICVQDNGAAVNATMDVTGYATAAGFTGTQARLLDTRPATEQGGLQGPLAGGTVYHFNTNLAAGTIVALNVTAVGPNSVGNLRVFPEPASGMPAASAVPNTAVDTYIPGTDGGSMVITQVGGPTAGATPGYIDLYSDTAGTVNVVVDEIGTFQAGSSVHAIAAPLRTEDTRPGPVAAGVTTNVSVAPLGSGSSFIPANALAVAGNIADINPSGPGYLVAFPGGGAMPATSSINNYPMQTRSNNALVAINPSNGMISVANVGASTNFTFDATAYIQ